MGGTVVIIIVLVVFPVLVLMSAAPLSALIGWAFTSDREDAFEGTEYLALGGHSPKADDEDDEEAPALPA